jgi:hypothetical protein
VATDSGDDPTGMLWNGWKDAAAALLEAASVVAARRPRISGTSTEGSWRSPGSAARCFQVEPVAALGFDRSRARGSSARPDGDAAEIRPAIARSAVNRNAYLSFKIKGPLGKIPARS